MYCLKCQLETGASAVCPRCGQNIPTMYSNQALEYTSLLFLKPSKFAASTTAAGLIVNIGGLQAHYAGVVEESASLKQIEALLWKYPHLEDCDFDRLENPMREDIEEARSLLIEKVLRLGRTASFRDKRKVINLMGMALDMQTGKDTIVYGKKGTNRILPSTTAIDFGVDTSTHL